MPCQVQGGAENASPTATPAVSSIATPTISVLTSQASVSLIEPPTASPSSDPTTISRGTQCL